VTASQLRIGRSFSSRCFGSRSFSSRSFSSRSFSSRSFSSRSFSSRCFSSRCFGSRCFGSRCSWLGSAASFWSSRGAFSRSSWVSSGRSGHCRGRRRRSGGSRLAADEQDQRQQSEILLHGNLPQSGPCHHGQTSNTRAVPTIVRSLRETHVLSCGLSKRRECAERKLFPQRLSRIRKNHKAVYLLSGKQIVEYSRLKSRAANNP
jgi:hypothetical protein